MKPPYLDFRRPSKDTDPHIDLTPMIDIIFQLLIFFMISSTFLYSSVGLNLPRLDSEQQTPLAQPLSLVLTANGDYYLNDEQVNYNTLGQAIQSAVQNNPQASLHVQADALIPYQSVLEAMQLAGQAGISHFELVYQKK